MAELCGLEDASTLRWTRADESDVDATPFWYVDLPSEELARAIASRALLVRRFDDWTFERVELALVRAVSFERALGAHVMPVTKGGYAHAFRLARDVLPSFR